MYRKFFFLTVVILAAGFVRSSLAEEAVSVSAQWTVSLDTSGKVVSLAIKPGRVKDALKDQLEAAIRQWRFEPGSVNGEPSATETTLFVDFTVSINAQETGYDIRIDSVDTGGTVKSMKMPKYPMGQGFREVGLVVLEVAYNEQGKPEKVTLAENSPVRKGRLVNSAITSVKSWTFEPERVANHAVSGRAYQPICFTTSSKPNCSWTPPESDVPTTSERSVALDSRVQLKSDVVGKSI